MAGIAADLGSGGMFDSSAAGFSGSVIPKSGGGSFGGAEAFVFSVVALAIASENEERRNAG